VAILNYYMRKYLTNDQ